MIPLLQTVADSIKWDSFVHRYDSDSALHRATSDQFAAEFMYEVAAGNDQNFGDVA